MDTSLLTNLKEIFNFATIIVVLLGMTTFILTLFIDWLSPKRDLKDYKWYLQELIYTLISIFLGMFVCLALKTSSSMIYIVGIIMGLIGSTILRKLLLKKDSIADKVVEQVEHKVEDIK